MTNPSWGLRSVPDALVAEYVDRGYWTGASLGEVGSWDVEELCIRAVHLAETEKEQRQFYKLLAGRICCAIALYFAGVEKTPADFFPEPVATAAVPMDEKSLERRLDALVTAGAKRKRKRR